MKNLLILATMLLTFGFAKAQYMYDGSGRQIGKVSGDYFYDGSGRQIGKISGDYLYDGSGRQIGKSNGLRRRQVMLFFYFFM